MTSYLDELSDLVLLHAAAQGLDPERASPVLARIARGGVDSWADEWLAAAHAQDDLLDVVRYANLGRFPFVDGPARAECLKLCTSAFSRWAEGVGAERRQISDGSAAAGVWLSGRALPDRPVLLLIGGIVSIKEQWGQMLPLAGRLRVTIAATELPGVGENGMSYSREHDLFVSRILDEIGVPANGDVRVLALSFSFTAALSAALDDPRIRAIGTVGGPVGAFFEDPAVWAAAPETTRRTWCHILGASASEAIEMLAATSVPRERLSEVRRPVAYVASRRDEIVPFAEAALLQGLLPSTRVLVHDDVHGAPRHLAVTRMWLLGRLLGAPGPSRRRVRHRVAYAGAAAVELIIGPRERGHSE